MTAKDAEDLAFVAVCPDRDEKRNHKPPPRAEARDPWVPNTPEFLLLESTESMLPRVLEPEAMDTAEEARDYDAMDHTEVNARFVSDFLKAHGACRGGEILDVGTGPGRIPIELCRRDPSARVVGVDLAHHMLDLARRNIESAGLSDRIRLAHADAKTLSSSADGRFEAVLSNTIIHHIPDPVPALSEMARAVTPGGTLMVRDLARPSSKDELDHLVATYAGQEEPAARALFAASLHAALTLEEVRAIVRLLGMPDDGVAMTSDRHWTWIWSRPANPGQEGP